MEFRLYMNQFNINLDFEYTGATHPHATERGPQVPAPASPSAEVTALAAEMGLSTQPLAHTIERDTYTPALLGLLNNVLVWGGSRVFHHVHEVGTNEWRLISALGNHPGATAQDLAELLGINKSIVSKSTKVLQSRELIELLDGPRGSRHLFLTQSGVTVHDDFMPIALKRQEILQEALNPEEVIQLNKLLLKMLASQPSMQQYEREILNPAG